MRLAVAGALLALAAAVVTVATGLPGGAGPPVADASAFASPEARSLVVGPGRRFVMSTNFGLVAWELGAPPRWSCPLAMGLTGDYAPAAALGPGYRLLAAHFGGLYRSDDGGCRYQPAGGGLERHPRFGGRWVDDVEVNPWRPHQVWAATSTTARENGVYVSGDGGQTFELTSLNSPLLYYKSVRVARASRSGPGRPGFGPLGAAPGGPERTRLYATAYGLAPVIRTYLYRSDDGGGTWRTLDYDGEGGAVSSRTPLRPAGPANPSTRALAAPAIVDVRVAATSRRDPDLLYLRLEDHHATRSVLVRAHGGDGPPPGGERYTPVLEARGRISVGITARDELLVTGTQLGLQRSRDRGRTWEVLLPAPGPPCVATWENRIFVCGSPGVDAYVAAELTARRQVTPLALWHEVQMLSVTGGGGDHERRLISPCVHPAAPPGAVKVGPAAPHDLRASRCTAEWDRWKRRLARPRAPR